MKIRRSRNISGILVVSHQDPQRFAFSEHAIGHCFARVHRACQQRGFPKQRDPKQHLVNRQTKSRKRTLRQRRLKIAFKIGSMHPLKDGECLECENRERYDDIAHSICAGTKSNESTVSSEYRMQNILVPLAHAPMHRGPFVWQWETGPKRSTCVGRWQGTS